VRGIYKWWSAIVVVAIVAQIGAAGYGAFYVAKRADDTGESVSHDQFENAWDFHAGFGYIVVLGLLILLVLALIARLGRPRIWLPLGLAVAGILQVIFAWLGDGVPGLGFLHPINAFAILAMAGANARLAWGAAPPAPASAPAA